MIFYEGHFVEKDPHKALDQYIRGAAKNNAFCFYELARLHADEQYFRKNPQLEFLYLKRAAEEGYVDA
jgi:TPR repeat protein